MEESDIAKLLEGHPFVLEQVGQHVFLASVEAVGHLLLQLQHTAYAFLHIYRIGKIANLLELVDAQMRQGTGTCPTNILAAIKV